MRHAILAISFTLLCAPGIAWGQFARSSNANLGYGNTPAGTSSAAQTTNGAFGSRSVGGGGISAGSRTFGGTQGALDQIGEGAGQVTGSERFIRGNRQAGQFVGADSGEQGGAFVGATTGSGLTGQSGLGGLGGLGGQQGFGLQGYGQQGFGQGYGQQVNRGGSSNTGRNARTVRSTLRLGFAPTAANPTVVSSRITGILSRSPRIESITPIQVSVVAGTAILRGTVATEHARDLAQQVVLLEPGISQVQNELAVQGQTPLPPADPFLQP